MNNIDPRADVRRKLGIALIGLLFLAVGPLCFWVLLSHLPAGPKDTPSPHDLLWIAVAAAGLGSMIHGATSFSSYVGNRNLSLSWTWWYVLRTPMGIGLALLCYFALRAGNLLNTSSDNPYTVAFFSGTAGMFSKQATDKLRELFDTFFRSRGDAERKQNLAEAAPVIIGVSPSTFPVRTTPPPALKLTGSHFTDTAKVLVSGEARTTRFISATEMSVQLTNEDVSMQRTLTLIVQNAQPSDLKSNPFEISVTAATQEEPVKPQALGQSA